MVAEGEFGDEDDVIFEEGKSDGLKYWQHKTLYGRDYAANYIGTTEVGGYREIQFITIRPFVKTDNLHHLQKYDGKVLPYSLPKMTDSYGFDGNNGNIYIRIRNIDAGWTDALNPDASATAAYMNGWEATANDGSHYTQWKSKYDGSAPVVQSIDYVKVNIAPRYKGYRLHYIPENPEPITNLQEELWSIVPGDNYIDIECGMVLGEVATISPDDTYAYINGTQATLKNQVEVINSIYKNGVYDSWQFVSSYNPVRGNGYSRVVLANYDVNAVYTADYQILNTLHAQAFSLLEFSYAQDIVTGIGTIAMALEGKQQHDNALDILADLSRYEETVVTFSGRACHYSGNVYQANAMIKLEPKNSVPIFTIIPLEVFYYYNGVATIPQSDYKVFISKKARNCFLLSWEYTGSDQAVVTGIESWGLYFNFKVIADCTGGV
jgi:hypothetical protein